MKSQVWLDFFLDPLLTEIKGVLIGRMVPTASIFILTDTRAPWSYYLSGPLNANYLK